MAKNETMLRFERESLSDAAIEQIAQQLIASLKAERRRRPRARSAEAILKAFREEFRLHEVRMLAMLEAALRD